MEIPDKALCFASSNTRNGFPSLDSLTRQKKQSTICRSLIPALILVCLIGGSVSGQQPPASPTSQETHTDTASMAAFWFTWLVVTVFVAIAMLLVRKGLSDSSWSLADAVSEEAGNQGILPAGQKPVMVASSSRLIALLGLLVLLALFLGVGYGILWKLFSGNNLPDMSQLAYFFLSGLALFAPYAFNQVREAFSVLGPATPPAPSPVTITVDRLPDGTVNSSYNASLQATGGIGTYTWSVISGNLPPGLTLNANGAISGTPTTVGSFSFTAQVQDRSSPAQTGSKPLSISIT